MDEESRLIEGIGNEVLVGIAGVAVLVTSLIFLATRYRWRATQSIHPESRSAVEDARLQLQQRRSSEAVVANGEMVRIRRGNDSESQCPICLGVARFAVETNCGHLFCGQCMAMYWRHGTWLGPARCPVCRQQVTLLLLCFTEGEQNSAELEDVEERNKVVQDSNDYNRRFSGEPRPLMDYVFDLPTLLRHLWNEFFSVGGLMYMFRIRIILCFFAASMYLISPLDIIPEAVFGILGLLDDMFVILLLAVYISIIYRRFIASRAQGNAS